MNNDDILELTETEVALEAAFESCDGLSNILDAHVQGKLTDPRFVTDISNTFIGRLGLETIGSNVSMEGIVDTIKKAIKKVIDGIRQIMATKYTRMEHGTDSVQL